jgi:hypothetical protein
MSNIIPNEILKKFKLTGAKIELLHPGLYSITNVNIGDNTWEFYKNWIDMNEISNKIKIGAGFFPTIQIRNSDKCPSLDLTYQIQTEANSLISHYSILRDPHFVIPGPIDSYKMLETIPYKNIIKLAEIIQNPPINYPIIYNLKSKSYICTLNHQWNNVGILINLFKK